MGTWENIKVIKKKKEDWIEIGIGTEKKTE